MPITTRTSGDVTVVKLSGLLVADDQAAELRDLLHTLIDSGHIQIVLNCEAFIQDAAMTTKS